MIRTIAFTSEGPPHDEGLIFSPEEAKVWEDACWEGGTTTYKLYTPRSICAKESDKWCVQRFPDKDNIPGTNVGYGNVGFGAWKSVMFRETADLSVDGDIIVYHDANWLKMPINLLFAKNLRAYALKAMTLTDFFVPFHEYMGKLCGAEIINHLVSNQWMREEIAKAPMGRGRLLIFKVNNKTRKFCRTFEETLKNNLWLLPPVRQTAFPGCDFSGRGTYEQAVLNVIAYRDGLLPLLWKNTWAETFRNAGYDVGNSYEKMLGVKDDFDKMVTQNVVGNVSNSKYTIVIQGFHHGEITSEIVKIFLERNSSNDVAVIVSTFTQTEHRDGFLRSYRPVLTEFERSAISEGRLTYIFIDPPDWIAFQDFWGSNHNNQNLERLSAYIGIKHAKSSNVLTIRSDCVLGRPDVCLFLDDLSTSVSPTSDCQMSKRIVVSNRSVKYGDRWNPDFNIGDYHIANHFYFGTTGDILNFCNVKGNSVWDKGRGIRVNTTPENQMMECWMTEMGIPASQAGLEEIAGRYFVFVDSTDVEFVHLKKHSIAEYKKRGLEYVCETYQQDLKKKKYSSHQEWKTWSEKYF